MALGLRRHMFQGGHAYVVSRHENAEKKLSDKRESDQGRGTRRFNGKKSTRERIYFG
jgi:hypothetical protein